MEKQKSEMSIQDVQEFLHLMDRNHIEVWIDGGWAVDALLGQQTRSHADLDIAVKHRDASRIRALLEARGYKEIPQDDSWLCNFVMGDEKGHRIDIHSFELNTDGKCIFGVPYPRDSLNGSGTIEGLAVKCITPKWLVQFHTAYPLDEKDYQDVKALCEKFNLQMPKEFEEFQKKHANNK